MVPTSASIPPSIGRLQSLEILNLGETLIEELPTEIAQLRCLRNIRVFHSKIDGSLFKNVIGARVPMEIAEEVGHSTIRSRTWICFMLINREKKMKFLMCRIYHHLLNTFKGCLFMDVWRSYRIGCAKAGDFQMLKELVLCRLGKLRHVTVQEGAMPHLQVLRLQDCKLLEEVPLGVEFLAHLKQVTFVNMEAI